MSIPNADADNLNQFAILRYEGHNVRCNSLREAKQAWEKLTPVQQTHASIVADGTMYDPPEIERM